MTRARFARWAEVSGRAAAVQKLTTDEPPRMLAVTVLRRVDAEAAAHRSRPTHQTRLLGEGQVAGEPGGWSPATLPTRLVPARAFLERKLRSDRDPVGAERVVGASNGLTRVDATMAAHGRSTPARGMAPLRPEPVAADPGGSGAC